MLLIGIGWGYHLDIIEKFLQKSQISFFEPVYEIQVLLQDSGRLQQWKKAGITILDSIDSAELTVPFEAVLIFPQHRRYFPDLQKFAASLLPRIEQKSVDQSTSKHFLRSWLRGCFIRFDRNPTLNFISSISMRKKILFCGAGPGLLEDLRNRPDRNTFIIAADTALAPLLLAGIRPDLVLSVDSGPGTSFHLTAAQKAKGTLDRKLDIPVLTWMAGAGFLSEYFSEILYYRSTFPVDQILGSSLLSYLPEWTNPARNTIGLAVRIAHMSGAEILYTAGAGFVSRRNRTHEKDTGYFHYAMQRCSRTYGIDMYRPGGYASEPTAKNRAALSGVEEMGDELGLQLLAWNGPDAPFAIHKSGSSSPDPVALKKYPIEAGKAAGRLLEMWPHLETLEIPGPPGFLDAWKTRLKEMVTEKRK